MSRMMKNTTEFEEIATAGLAISLVVGIALTLMTLITCCLLFRAKKDLRVLRRKFDYAIATGKGGNEENTPQETKEFNIGLAELGSSNRGGGGRGRDENGGGKSDHSPLISPTTPTAPNTHQAPPTTTTKVVQIESTGTGGYSAVNMLSILPDDVRTEENLEGGSLPEDQAQKLISDYNKQRKEYEERQLQKQAIAEASGSSPSKVDLSSSQKQTSQIGSGAINGRVSQQQQQQQSGAVRALKFTPGYEDMEDPPPAPGYDTVVLLSKSVPVSRKVVRDEYEDPADAVPSEIAATRSHLRGTKSNVVVPKSQVSPNEPKKFQMATNVGDEYTAVYNPGEAKIIGGQPVSMKRAMSDSSPSHRLVNGSHSSPGKQPHHYTNTVGGMEAGNSSSGGSMDDMSKGFDRKEPIRGSKHKSAKEEVEFDPTSKKVFRVTSTKKKRTANGKDQPDGGEEDSNGDSSPDSKSHTKEKQFDLYGDYSGEEYSMVNVADKKKYRTEDDVMKKEGSGIPQRYNAKSPLKQEVA